MMDPILLFIGIAVLTVGRFWYIRANPVQRDVHDFILPLSKRLHGADFFRRPKSEEIRFSFWIVQYGVIWWAINLPLMNLARFDGRRWGYIMAVLDIPFLWLSSGLGAVGLLIYAGINTFNLLKAPWNVSIVWLIMCAVFSWVFLLIAPIAKLPLGIPTWVWGHVRQALLYQKNPFYYGLLGVLWLFVAWRTLIPGVLSDTFLGQVASLAAWTSLSRIGR